MKEIKIISVKRYPTEYKVNGEHREAMTNVRWTFSNGVSVSVMRIVINYSATNQSKIIAITPAGGLNKTFLEVRHTLNVVRKAAWNTFDYSWDINIQL